MSITIYQFEHSPFCIPITAIFRSLTIPVIAENVSNGNRATIIELTGGAYYQVPVLQDEGTLVFESTPESQDIARYIDTHYAEGRLFPAPLEGIQRVLIPNLEDEVEGVTFKLVDPLYLDAITDPVERMMIVRHKERKFGRGCIDQWKADRAKLTAQAESVLMPYELMLRNHAFLLGNSPVYSDFLLYGILGNLTYRGYNEIPASLKAIQAWMPRMKDFIFSGF